MCSIAAYKSEAPVTISFSLSGFSRLVKVKAQRAKPINESENAMASAAAESDPSPLDLDLEAVYFYSESTLVGWDSLLWDHLIQVAARHCSTDRQRDEMERWLRNAGSVFLGGLARLRGRGLFTTRC